ncbi:MAG: helix-turn-helix transcriptional regulator [Solirubrobacterales bacterium]|nr:helix-turn-helix transcriptional regulator [Solirubrobacterales bacterium]
MRTPFATAEEVGIAAKRARLNAGYTQDDLAKELGTTRKRIGNIESGDESTLGDTPELWFSSLAPIAAATGDLAMIGLDDLGDLAELVSLRRDVNRVDRRLRGLLDVLVEADLVDASAIDLLLEQLDTNEPPLDEEPGEDEDQKRG